MITTCCGHRNDKNEIVSCGRILKGSKKELGEAFNDLIGAQKKAVDLLSSAQNRVAFEVLKISLAKHAPSSGNCAACYHQLKKSIQKMKR